jgi:hypothetical protein
MSAACLGRACLGTAGMRACRSVFACRRPYLCSSSMHAAPLVPGRA